MGQLNAMVSLSVVQLSKSVPKKRGWSRRYAKLWQSASMRCGAAAAAEAEIENYHFSCLADMQGLWDAQKNIRALRSTGGNVEAAIELIFSGQLDGAQ